MHIIFPANPLTPTQPDPAYADEVAAAQAAGFTTALMDFEVLTVSGDPARTVRRVPPGEALYRGWMLTSAQYTAFHTALADRNAHLLTDPDAYRHCHWLPESYGIIEAHTPTTVYLPDTDIDAIMQALQPFGDTPIIVKDYVKSQKHYWAEACYIPSAADRAAVARVVSRFIELQGAIEGGLVFREYVPLADAGTHPESGMPLGEEVRIFWLNGKPLAAFGYWAAAESEPRFHEVAQQVRSPFFTMDIARTAAGEWIIIELGDGQVAGLPAHADRALFYEVLYDSTH